MLELSEDNDESELVLRESIDCLFMDESFQVGPVSKRSRIGMQKHFRTLVIERDRPLSLRENMTSSASGCNECSEKVAMPGLQDCKR